MIVFLFEDLATQDKPVWITPELELYWESAQFFENLGLFVEMPLEEAKP